MKPFSKPRVLSNTLLVFAFYLPSIASTQPAPNVPEQYKRLFFEYSDLHLYEKALNSVGLTARTVGRSYALIAGVTQYPNFPDPEQSLRPAAVDIEKLKLYLKNQEYFDEIVVLKDGDMNLDNLNYFLQNYLPDRLRNSPHSRFLFAYSGHGYAEPAGEIQRGFLLTSVARSTTDPLNRIDLSVLRTLLDPVIDSAEKVLVLVNACQSGAFLGRKSFGPNPLGPGDRGAHAIMASRSNQSSLQLDRVGPGSVFFEKIFGALEGAADNAPRDGVVTYHELDTYLRSEIPYATGGSQIPMEGDISRNGSVGEFFFLSRSRQVQLGNTKPWNPGNATKFGVPDNDFLEKGESALKAGQFDQAFQDFQQAAAGGNTVAMKDLGNLYRTGKGVTQDYQEARQWYEKAAAAGLASAMNNLGVLYKDGMGVARDFQQARQWYEKAAAAGDARGMNNLGLMYERVNGGPQDYQQARQWYEKAAAAGDASGMDNLGMMYERGKGGPQDYQKARQWFEKAAEAGRPLAMTNLGALYANGRGVKQDYLQARQWFEKAAEAGDASGMDNLGMMYERGNGGPQDFQQARQWYEKAAAAEDARGMNNLGLMYERGNGGPQDYQQARQWYEKAAAAGDARGMNNLGMMYERGKGGPQDYQKARQWFEKAAEAGLPSAMTNLGALYANGHGVTKDYRQARQWFEKAAEAGDTGGMTNLGMMYERGDGGPRDYQKARQWYEKAAAAGDEGARQRLKAMRQ
jgi:TPR repeat protein